MRFLTFIILLSIFLATHGHTATIDVAAKAEELRDKFIRKLQESSLTGEDISNITTQSEELLNQLKSADDSDASIQKRGEALADLLTLKHPVHDTALNEGLILKSASRQPIIIDEAARIAFKNRLQENFTIPHFKNLNTLFSQRTWKGHVKYPYADLGANRIPSTAPTEQITGYFERLVCNSSDASTCSSTSEIKCTFKKPSDASKITAIIISVYGGMKKGFCFNLPDLNLPSDTIMEIVVRLPDWNSNIDQWDQFQESNFKNTHADYLRIVSDFVKKTKTEYPGIPIFLKGDSLGGFFVSSYALLQSTGINSNVFKTLYKGFVQKAFTEQFSGSKITPIDGIISYSGAINNIDTMLDNNAKWSHYLEIPAFYHWNFDDERVDLKKNINSILPTNGAYNHKITLSINRRGAQDSLGDLSISPDANDLERLRNASNNSKVNNSTIRGHFNTNNLYLAQQVVHFIHHAKKMADSPLHQARLKQQFAVYRAASGKNGTIYPEHIQQFLSNLRNTQQELEQIPAEKRALLSKRDIIEKHMHGIMAPLSSDTIIQRYVGFMNFIKSSQSFEGRKVYHDQLMNYVTTKGLWHGALEKLKQDPTFKENRRMMRLIRLNETQQNVRNLNRSELQKTNPFLVEHITAPYDHRLTEFNKSPRLTQNYSSYTDSIIKLLADPTKVSLTHYANLIERKAIFQAVMASEITNAHQKHGQGQQDQSEQVKNFNSECIKHSNGTPLHNHFAALYFAADFAALRSKSIISGYQGSGFVRFDENIEKIIGINYETFNRWFNEVYRHHKIGFDKSSQQ